MAARFGLTDPQQISQVVLLLATFGYLLAFAVARRVMVARPKGRVLQARAEVLRREIELTLGQSPEPLTTLLQAPAAKSSRWLWNAEDEVDRAIRLAAAHRLFVDVLPSDEIRPRLQSCLMGSASTALSDSDRDEIARTLAVTNAAVFVPRGRRMLQTVIAEQQRVALSDYREQLTLYRKTWWLTIVALALVVVIGFASDRLSAPLLAGAVGGFFASISHFTRSDDIPVKYQTSWSMITLAIPVGALGGAVTVLLLAALHWFGLAGQQFRPFATYLASSTRPLASTLWTVVAIAFLGGFSARLVERLAQRLDESVESAKPASLQPPGTARGMQR
jgi:hypothetical protein